MNKIDLLLKCYTFTNELGEKILWREGQKTIISSILDLGVEGSNYVQIETSTQYGKSSGVAAGLVMRCTKNEKWAIVAGTGEKAQIIMDYFINFCLENPIPRELLKAQVALDKLKMERSRRHLRFTSGFEIRVFSADATNKQATGNAIMGMGAPFVILDEGALVDDQIESKIFRMMGGFSTTKHFYLKIGNPFYRNHFLKSHNDPDFKVIVIDYIQAIKEGRYTQAYIEKAREKPNFNILYEVKFPPADAIDTEGWKPLITEEEVERAMVEDGSGFGFLRIGIDPSGEGANNTVGVERYRNYARVFYRKNIVNQFDLTDEMKDYINNRRITGDILPEKIYIDRIGIGEGFYQTLNRSLENVQPVNVGVSATDRDNFVNLRAEAYWRLRQDIVSGKLKLEKDDCWLQLTKIKYRTKLEGKKGKIEIMDKQKMRKLSIDSPDEADALALTFVEIEPHSDFTDKYVEQEERDFDRHALFNEIP